jgi:hypothetical protein
LFSPLTNYINNCQCSLLPEDCITDWNKINLKKKLISLFAYHQQKDIISWRKRWKSRRRKKEKRIMFSPSKRGGEEKK